MAVGLGLMPMNTAWADCAITGGTAPNEEFTCDNVPSPDTNGVNAGGGNDTIIVTPGTVVNGNANAIRGGDGNDSITVTGATINHTVAGNGNDDQINISNSRINTNVLGGWGSDTITVSGSTVGSSVDGGTDGAADAIEITNSTIGGNVLGRNGNDTITISGSTITGDVIGGLNADVVEITDSSVRDLDLGLGTNTESGTDSLLMTGGTARRISTSGGSDTIEINGATITDSVLSGAANDQITIRNSQITNSVNGVGNSDTITVSGSTIGLDVDGGNDNGADAIEITGSEVNRNVLGRGGNDAITITGSTITGDVIGGQDADVVEITNSSVRDLDLGEGANTESGADSLLMTGGTARGISTSGGSDTIEINGATITDSVFSGAANDRVNISNTQITNDIDGRDGSDWIEMTNNSAVGNLVLGGNGNDTIILDTSTTSGIQAGNGNDSVLIDNGTVTGTVFGGLNRDTITVSGGTVSRIEFGQSTGVNENSNEIFTLTGGTVGDVFMSGGNDTANLTGGTLTGTVSLDLGNDSLVVGEGTVLAAAWALDGGTGTNNVRIEVADGETRTIEDGDITGFQTILFDNQTTPTANGTINLESTGGGIVLDTGGITGGTSVRFSQRGIINFVNTNGDEMIRAEEVTFDAGTILTGNGTIITSSSSASFNGTVAPGGFGTIGTIAVNGSAAFGATAVLAADLSGTNISDLITVTGATSIADGMSVIINYLGDASLLVGGEVFTLVQSTGPLVLAGTVNLAVPPNAVLAPGLAWEVTAIGSSLVVQVISVMTVPEPATLGAFGAGTAGLMALRRHRRRRRRP